MSLVMPQIVFGYNTRIPGLVFHAILYHLTSHCSDTTKRLPKANQVLVHGWCWYGFFVVGSTNKPSTTGMLFHRRESICRVTSLHRCICCRFPSIARNNCGGLSRLFLKVLHLALHAYTGIHT